MEYLQYLPICLVTLPIAGLGLIALRIRSKVSILPPETSIPPTIDVTPNFGPSVYNDRTFQNGTRNSRN